MLIDFHAHVLPCADHGSDGIETSLGQLDLLRRAGIERVVATPHFYPHRHRVTDFIARRNAAFDLLRSSAGQGTPEIIPGAEVLVCEGLEEMNGLEHLTINGGRTILLEMPMTPWSGRLIETVAAIADKGLVPVMAHVDRYPSADAERLIELGNIKFQLNAHCLVKPIGRKRFSDYIDRGSVVALGSDLHGLDRSAYRDFMKACAFLGRSDRLAGIMSSAEKLIL